jgi:hypothetical protein
MSKFTPPAFADASPLAPYHKVFDILRVAFIDEKWPIEIEYVKKGIIIENID